MPTSRHLAALQHAQHAAGGLPGGHAWGEHECGGRGGRGAPRKLADAEPVGRWRRPWRGSGRRRPWTAHLCCSLHPVLDVPESTPGSTCAHTGATGAGQRARDALPAWWASLLRARRVGRAKGTGWQPCARCAVARTVRAQVEPVLWPGGGLRDAGRRSEPSRPVEPRVPRARERRATDRL